MPAAHVEQLFSAAYDDMLSEREAERFHGHVRECASCADAYERFRTSIDAVRQLPPARMPQKVHLPSTAPVAEMQPLWTRLRQARPQLRYGGATALALAAAAVILAVSVLHPGSARPGGGGESIAVAPGANSGASAAGQCQPRATSAIASAPPAGYSYLSTNSDSRRPGQNLVLASSTNQVAAGGDVVVYAQLTLPTAQAAAPGVSHPGDIGAAVVPCLSIEGLRNASFAPALRGSAGQSIHGGALSNAAAPQASQVPGLSPLVEFTVPPGTPPGTVLVVVATIPSGYPHPGDPPLSASLQITVR